RHPAPADRGRTRPASACRPQRSFGDGPIDIGWSSACGGESIRQAMASSPHGEEAGKKGRPWPRRSSGSSALGLGLVGFLVTLGLGGLELLAQLGLEPLGHLRVLLEVVAGVLLALADALAAVAVPGAGLVDELGVHAHVDQLAFPADALAVQDLGDDLLER